MKIKVQVFSENHPEVTTSYNNIGLLYVHLGNYSEALELYQKGLMIGLQVFGESHPDVALSYSNIGLVCNSLGVYDKALEFYQKALKILLKAYGKNHPHIEITLESLITCAKKALLHEVKTLKELSVLCTKIFGTQHLLAEELAQLVK